MSSDDPRPVKIYLNLYSYAHNNGTNQTARVRILIRILVVRCSDNLFIGLCMPNSNLRRAAETKQDVVV